MTDAASRQAIINKTKDNKMKTRILLFVAAICCATAAMAEMRVSGKVTDKNGDELPGVNVRAEQDEKTIAGTVTDGRGRFSLSVQEDTEKPVVVELSFVGYESERMQLPRQERIDLGVIVLQEAATKLGEVTVESKAVIQKADRQILLPNKEQTAASTDGVSLIQNLQLPRIVVNPADNSIKTLSNDAVQLRINGIEATNAEVLAISPKDVIRIEYHDQPGVRYNDAAAVIDYIVRHRDTGGSLKLNTSSGVTMLGIGQYHAAGKVHFGKSSLALMAGTAPRDAHWTRTNEETYIFGSDTIVNSETGEPTRFKTTPVMLGLTYNWTNGDPVRGERIKDMLNIRLQNNMDFTPFGHSDRDSRLIHAADSFAIHDHQSSYGHTPSLDVYYQHNLPHNQHIYLDLVGTYIHSRTDRVFRQLPLAGSAGDTTDVRTKVQGSKWSLIGEGIYEKEWEKVVLTAGVRHNQQWVENRYLQDTTVTAVNMQTAETYAFAEVKQRIGKFSYVAGVGAMHTLIEQGAERQSTWTARPQLTLSYDLGKGVFWKYKGYVSGYQPSLSSLNDVSQQIDKYQIRRGNPNLKPVMFVSNEMQLSWENKYISLNIWANYSYDHKPIMEETHLATEYDDYAGYPDAGQMVVRTDANQRGFHRLKVSPSVQVKLLQNKLMFTIAPFANYYVSQGNNYTHRYFNPGIRAGVFGLYKEWRFWADVTTRYNDLWGETLQYGEIYHNIGINYNKEQWGFGVMMINPFSRVGYVIDTKNLSALAPNTRHAEMPDFRQVVMVNFTVNLDFGTKHSEGWKRIENEDKESGILSGTKN